MMNLALVLMVISPIISKAFILSGPSCVNNDRCSCSKTGISCSFDSLPEVPEFFPLPSSTSGHLSRYTIRLSGNKITSVHSNAFQNISSVNASRLYLYLDINKITTIDEDAFVGIKDSLSELWLQSNKLTTIPAAIGSLQHLDTLYIYGNPLTSISNSVAVSLGASLTYLWMDVASFPTWPHQLGSLKMLTTLVIGWEHNNNQVPRDAFQGLETILQSLTISHSNLSTVPSAICSLRSLTTLTVTDNVGLATNAPILEGCQQSFKNLSIVDLSRNHLKTFPDIFGMFPHVWNINLEENEISAIETNLVPSNNGLYSLNMKKNRLTAIPASVTKMSSLDTLSLSYNNISSIHGDDLSGLTGLTQLDLSHNPLRYVSPGAFQDTPNLSQLNLEFANLTAIPAGVPGLHTLAILSMMGNPVVCNCSMTYMKAWSPDNKFFTGFCNGDPLDQTLSAYITGPLQKCA